MPCRRDREEEDEERAAKRLRAVENLFELEVDVDSDDNGDEGDEFEDGFIVPNGVELSDDEEEDDGRRRRINHSFPQDDDEEDPEEIERRIHEKYREIEYDGDENDGFSEVEQQALLPSITDPKLWLVKCTIGRERETAVCLMQKYINVKRLQINSAVALDHLKGYIYVEAKNEAHVREACRGLRSIYSTQKITQVPIKEMAGVVSVETKEIELAQGTRVRLNIGIYKGDLAQVVDVDVRRRVTVKLIPRLDLQAIADKQEQREVKKKPIVPVARLLDVEEARDMGINVSHKRDKLTGEYFEKVAGHSFKDGFLYKTVSVKSIYCHNIQPTFDELLNFNGDGDEGNIAKVAKGLSSALINGKSGQFVKGDPVLVAEGDLKNLKGFVDKVEDEIVHIRPQDLSKGLPKTIIVKEKELCKYFEPGTQVKIVCGGEHEGSTGMVVKAHGRSLVILPTDKAGYIHTEAKFCVLEHQGSSGTAYRKCDASPLSPTHRRLPRGRHDSLVGNAIQICQGAYKGYRGRVVGVIGDETLRVELESQMKVVIVKRSQISPQVGFGMASETPMHHMQTPLRPYMTPVREMQTPVRDMQTPLRPYMTPVRDPAAATPSHDGMRTPMRARAWDPCAVMTPVR